MTLDTRLVAKGKGEPREALIEEGRVHVQLGKDHATELEEFGWPAAKTSALAKSVVALEATLSTQAEARGHATSATATEHDAVAEAKSFIRRLRGALPVVLRGAKIAGVSLASFDDGKLGRSTPKISAYLTKVRPSVLLLEAALKPHFGGKKATRFLDDAKKNLDEADVHQESKAAALPADTGALYEAKGLVLELIEDMNRAGRSAFEGHAAVSAKFNKDILLRGRKTRAKAPAPPPAAPTTRT